MTRSQLDDYIEQSQRSQICVRKFCNKSLNVYKHNFITDPNMNENDEKEIKLTTISVISSKYSLIHVQENFIIDRVEV